MRAAEIRKVLVVGAGTMGQQIALQRAAHGFAVVLVDQSEDALDVAAARLDGLARQATEHPAFEGVDLAALAAGIARTTRVAGGAEGADVVAGSGAGGPELRGRGWAELDRYCPERTIFATNSSSLLPSMYADATGRADRFAALHFHQPVWSATVVDVMPHPGTSEATVETLLGFAVRIGQIPIPLHRQSAGGVFYAMVQSLRSAKARVVFKAYGLRV